MKTSTSDIARILGKLNAEGTRARVEQSGTGGWDLYVDRINPFDGKLEKDHLLVGHGSKKEIYERLIGIRFDPYINVDPGTLNPYEQIGRAHV